MGSEQGGGKLEFLLIDDEPTVRDTLADVLEFLGVSVDRVSGGQEGIDLYIKKFDTGKPYDIVLTDLNMPEVNGVDVIREIRKKSPDALVGFITGAEDTQQYKTLFEAAKTFNPNYMLKKPIQLKELKYVVEDAKQRLGYNPITPSQS